MYFSNKNSLIDELISELELSAELTDSLPNDLYSAAEDGLGSIGAHIRHNLDFVCGLLRGARTSSVDYADRERDKRVETDQVYAVGKIRAAIEMLRAVSESDMFGLLIVRSELRPNIRHRSSFSRELEFVYSHTVHHHALINERLRSLDMDQIPGLGVAPSTSAYWSGLKLAA